MLMGGLVSCVMLHGGTHHSAFAFETYSIQLSHQDLGRVLIMGVHIQNISSQ